MHEIYGRRVRLKRGSPCQSGLGWRNSASQQLWTGQYISQSRLSTLHTNIMMDDVPPLRGVERKQCKGQRGLLIWELVSLFPFGLTPRNSSQT